MKHRKGPHYRLIKLPTWPRLPWSGWLRRPVARVVGLSVLASLVVLAVVILRNPFHQVEAGWWNGGWQYRQRISVTNSGGDATDIQVLLTFNTETLITAEKMSSDCSDVRLTSQGGNILPHWIEPNTCNTTTTKIWVRVDSIPADNADVFLYYGNPTAPDTSTPHETFIKIYDNLVASYSFEEASWNGTAGEVKDDSGNNLDGTATVGATTNASGKFGKAGDFDGTPEKVLIADNAVLDVTRYTITAWVNFDFNPSGADSYFVINRGTASAFNFWLWHDADGSVCGANDNMVAGFQSTISTYPQTCHLVSPTAGQWYYMVATYDGANIKFYLDGALVDIEPTTATPATAGTMDMTIGTSVLYGTQPTHFFKGRIDEVRIYNEAKTADYITDTYGTGSDRVGYVTENYPGHELIRNYNTNVAFAAPASEETTPDPVAEWKFDEGSGQTVHDSTKQGNNGTLGANSGSSTDDPTWVAEDQCVSGKCLKFDGADDNVVVPQSSNLKVSSKDFTISAWVNPKVLVSGNKGIVSTNASSSINYILSEYNNGHFRIFLDNSGVNGLTTTVNTYAPNNWYHVVFVRDNANSKLRIYVNGIEDSSVTTPLNTGYSITNNSWLIGYGGGVTRYLNGQIDEVKIYPYARSAAQIKADYAAGAAALGATDQSFLSDGLMIYYPMDEGTGTSTADKSGNNNTGRLCESSVSNCLVQGPTWTSGKFGNALSFDGTNDGVLATTYYSSSNHSYSFAAWIYKTATPSGGQEYIFAANSGVSTLAVETNLALAFSYMSSTAANSIPLNQWTHVAQTTEYIGNLQQISKLYVNGDLKKQQTLTFGTADYVRWGGIGMANQDVNNYAFSWFEGKIDEARVYKRALSADEIKALYNWAPGPLLHLKMDDSVSGNGQTISDSSTYGNNGTTDDGANDTGMDCTVTGKYGKACQFDGVDDLIALNFSQNYNLTTIGSGYTLSAWIFPTDTDSYVLTNSGDSNFNQGNAFGVSSATTLRWRLFYEGAETQLSGTYSDGLLNTWSYVTARAEKTSDSLTTYSLWVNGKQIASLTSDKSYSSPATKNYRLGMVYRDYSSFGQFTGLIDDVKIYNYARTEAQIQQDMLGSGDSIQSSNTLPQPIAHWSFDEQAGQLARDQVNGLDATLGASESFISTDDPAWKTKQDCKINGCLSFDGGDFVNISDPNDTLDFDNDLSFGAWFKTTATSTQALLSRGETNDWQYAIYSNIQAASGKIDCVIYRSDIPTYGYLQARSTQSYIDGNWHHVMCTLKGNNLYQYIDGKLTASYSSPTGTRNIDSTGELYIGQFNWASNYYRFNGLIDEVKIYNTALTASQVAQDYAAGSAVVAGTTTSSEAADLSDGEGLPPILWFDMNDGVSGNGQPIKDRSGNNNNGTTDDGANNTGMDCTVPGKYGKGCKFDGSGDYISISGNSMLRPTNSISFGGWVKWNAFGNDSNGYGFIGYSNGATNGFSLYQNTVVPYNKAKAFVKTNAGPAGQVIGNTELVTDEWYHIFAVYNGSTLKLFINGKEESSTSLTGDIDWSGITGDLKIASSYASYFFNGSLDDIKIYNYARTPAQIAYDYNRGKPIAHWKMNECQGTTIHDASGNGFDGTLTVTAAGGNTNGIGTCNTATSAWGSGATGKYGASLNFDGDGDYIQLNNYSGIKFDEVTFSLWIKPTTYGNGYFFDSSSPRNVSHQISSGEIRWTTGSTALDTTTADLVSGQWYHITYVCSYSGDIKKIYVNGIEKASSTGSSCGGTPAGIFTLGSRFSFDYNISGLLDDVQIFNYALSANQVKKLYNESSVLRFGE